MKKWVYRIVGGLIAAFLLIQLVPYGRNHANPPVIAEPKWDSDLTRELTVRACYDCHSNESVWPWYSSIAPISWLVQRDVDEGRQRLNFSEWGSQRLELNELFAIVREGEMPPAIYLVQHPGARLTDQEIQQLIAGYNATFR